MARGTRSWRDVPVEIVSLEASEVPTIRRELVGVYREAFGQPPYFETASGAERFGGQLSQHTQRVGFRCLVARDAGQVVGFAYGYTSGQGQWWHDRVAAALDPATERRWLERAFELVELAVTPQRQGEGIGSRLHDALLTGLPHRTAVLSTMDTETRARQMYLKRGWRYLLRQFTFGGTLPFAVMGRDLSNQG